MRYLLFCLFLSLCIPLSAQEEKIEHFSVMINTRQDASLEITETITVVVQGDLIKRGLTRALNKEPIGENTQLENFKYEVLSVTRDGVDEPFFTKREGGLQTIYTGDKDVLLDPGTYVYEIRYRAFDQVYGLDKIDEIRWPLQGGVNGKFLIQDADITIRFDRDIQILRSACYTGVLGSTAEDCEYSQDGNIVTFVATKPLRPGEGMTVAASISAGYFQRPEPPTPVEKNATLSILVLGFAIALGYAYTSWQKYGVDPKGPPVKNEYFPPEGYSPASVDYLLTGWSSPRRVTASLTALAVNGYVSIREEERKKMFSTYDVFIIEPTDKVPSAEDVPNEQHVLYQNLLAGGPVELGGGFEKKVEAASKLHDESLSEQHAEYLKEGKNYDKILPLVGMAALTILGGVIAIYVTGYGGLSLLIAFFLFAFLVTGYAALIARPSLAKVTLKNKFKGLKQYLKLSEKKRKVLPNAPEMTEEYFQAILPYAIALGIENDWADALSEYLVTSGQQRSVNHFGYAPFMLAGFGSRFGQSYGTSAINPASSSGGGGGFSGGGGSVGGGGGTGGW